MQQSVVLLQVELPTCPDAERRCNMLYNISNILAFVFLLGIAVIIQCCTDITISECILIHWMTLHGKGTRMMFRPEPCA